MKQEYQEFIAKVRKDGGRLLPFPCPLCREKIETLAPPEGDLWDTLATCPHCEGTFFKRATATKVEAISLDEAYQWQK
ncbi:hypothetical protein V8X86_000801 [Escherichia coli]|uniref:hypothetical protein n=1 Tax=Phytobacter diazotrophicus TaxID=395631 RepID=UPI000CD286D3|nr:hypothetical protein [Phytobacter diazotrophicus]AUV05506.1 hypothetical protein C2U52_04010 [Enterobacteriaceae bacterium ENNIH2]QJF16633.1 hypothetical protein HHA33_08830 [Phytobacter diazotrophicus]